MWSGVLNPDLLHAMERTFARVEVVNPGRPLEGWYAADPDTGRRRLRVTEWGESYRADCPCCNDTRARLSVSHRYGVRDPETGFGGHELWKCFNEDCQSDRANRDQLRHMLTLARPLAPAPPVPRAPQAKAAAKPKLEPVAFPGILLRIDTLPNDHHAVSYLRDRNYDIRELAEKWDVSYAGHVPPRTRGAYSQDRIIIPVHDKGAMVGWQARFIGDVDWKATGVQKYLTYYAKSLCWYGLDEAEKETTLAIVEGVTSVWRYGCGAIPLLGKTMSATQAGILVERGRNRPVVLIPDTDDPASLGSFCKVGSDLRAAGYGGWIGYAPLPPDTDPAEMTRPRLRRLVAASAASCRADRPA